MDTATLIIVIAASCIFGSAAILLIIGIIISIIICLIGCFIKSEVSTKTSSIPDYSVEINM